MSGVTIYDKTSGALLRTFDGPAGLLLLQLAESEAVFDGLLPLADCRINVATGMPMYFEPPAPSPDHVWDAGRQSHTLTAEGMKRRQVRGEILMLEASQARALRELALAASPSIATTARDRLTEIDAAIAAKRGEL